MSGQDLKLELMIIKSPTYKKLLSFLIGMVIIGSILGIENSQAFGCVVGLDMLTFSNLFWMLFSVVILYLAMKSRDVQTTKFLILVELVVWILKLFFYKGGYITGFAGGPDDLIMLYDFMAISLRGWILLKLAFRLNFSWLVSVLGAASVVAIKVYFFALPFYTKVLWGLEDKKAKKQRIELMGTYQGVVWMDSVKTDIQVIIDGTKMKMKTEKAIGLKEEYPFEMRFPNYGYFETSDGSIEVHLVKVNKDSLVFSIRKDFEHEYLMRLKVMK